MNERILIVDDDALLRQSLTYSLRREQFAVASAATAAEALTEARAIAPDLILLDISLPDMDGWELCRRLLAERSVPIIFVTARGQEVDKIIGLEIGADDYIVKPFGTAELIARIHAVLRRAMRMSGQEKVDPLAAGPLRLNVATHEALFEERPLALSPKEFDLLYELARQAGKVVPTTALLSAVWGPGFQGEPQTLYVHIKQLRKQIEPDPHHPRYLLTVHAVGYKFDSEGRGRG